MKRIYSKFAGFCVNRYIKLAYDSILLIASGYLMIKKSMDFSISGWLLNNVLHQSGVNAYVYVSAALLITAIVLKLFSIIVEQFPIAQFAKVEPEEIADCLSAMNKEIYGHINKCASGPIDVTKLNEQHSFDVNMRVITEALAEHIRKSIDSIKIKRKDLFISVYSYDDEMENLSYELHYDHRRDLVKSKLIGINEDRFKEYESVRCFLDNRSTAYVHNKKKYSKGSSKRYKTIRHYMGCKLETNGHTAGFLNIEFHNNDVFMDEDEMQDFLESHVFAFKLLYEYQYLKHNFFNKFTNFNENWRVA